MASTSLRLAVILVCVGDDSDMNKTKKMTNAQLEKLSEVQQPLFDGYLSDIVKELLEYRTRDKGDLFTTSKSRGRF